MQFRIEKLIGSIGINEINYKGGSWPCQYFVHNVQGGMDTVQILFTVEFGIYLEPDCIGVRS